MSIDSQDVEEVMDLDNDLDLSQNSGNQSVHNQSIDSITSVGSAGSDGTQDNNQMNDSINSNTSVGSNGSKSVSKKRIKLSKEEKERRLKERELERERKAQEFKEKKELRERMERERQEMKELDKQKKEKERQERERERQEKESERQRLKDEKQREKEKSIKEREEKLKEKELERQKRLEELSEKKRKTDEEKNRKIEEKLKAEEEEQRKREKQRKILTNFFIKKSSEESINRKNVLTNKEIITNNRFLPFELSENQTMAPIVSEFAKNRFNAQELDRLFELQDSNQLYLNSIKTIDYKTFKCHKRDKSEPEIIIEGDDNQPKRYRIKHLQFVHNVRPPYRGTFRRTSDAIKPTKPFAKDMSLNYEVESDEEWEEGAEGESINGSDSDGSVKDDYEIDNEFFVPHGYLSEDENDENEEQMNALVDKDIEMTDDNTDPKEAKCRPLLKEQVLMAERNRSFAKTLNPIVMGCVWELSSDNHKFVESLKAFKRISIQNK